MLSQIAIHVIKEELHAINALKIIIYIQLELNVGLLVLQLNVLSQALNAL